MANFQNKERKSKKQIIIKKLFIRQIFMVKNLLNNLL